MDLDRWQQVEHLVRSARDLGPEERAGFLADACGDDPTLRDEVESLIRADAAAGDFLEDLVADEAGRLSGATWLGRRLGSYEILEEIGRGGMSRVFLAVRADRQYEKRVAVKVIRGGLDRRDLERRFRRERQILASLEHPYVARLIDAGLTPDGGPYFVMEHVDGERIDRYCDRHRLSISDRLKLFRRVCEAVQYAHRNLVVHRDLKPSNILVTEAGVPKLLDFGIAKLLDPDSFPQTVLPTADTARVMTPEYASPEQVRGHRVTTASDVYSLGVLLYEILTGQRPYRLPRRFSAAAERVICEQNPALPSESFLLPLGPAVAEAPGLKGQTPDRQTANRTPDQRSAVRGGTPDRLRRRLAGDLDNIVLTALRKEPQRRYASVEGLSEDLRRHLEGLPVTARKDTFTYRAGKFVRRHRTVLAAALIALSAILIGAATAFWQARVATAAQVAAEKERERAQQVSAFLRELFELSDPDVARGANLTARELLDRGAARIPSELAGQPRLQAALLETVGSIYLDLGLYERSVDLLGESLAMRRHHLGPQHLEVTETLNSLASALQKKGDSAAAEPLYREALEMRRRLLGEEHELITQSLNNLGQLLHSRGELEAAEALLREALEMKRRLLGDEHSWVADGVNNLAGVLYSRGQVTAAEALFQEALDLRRRLLGEDHSMVAESLNNLAVVLYRQGKLAEAEPLFRETLDLRRRLFGERHPAVARSLSNLAKLLSGLGNHAEAEGLFRQTLAMKRELLDEDNPSIAVTLNGLALALDALGRDAEAEALFREALELRQRKLAAGHSGIAESQVGLGRFLASRGRAEEAEVLLRAGYQGLLEALGEDDHRTREAGLALADLRSAERP